MFILKKNDVTQSICNMRVCMYGCFTGNSIEQNQCYTEHDTEQTYCMCDNFVTGDRHRIPLVCASVAS